MHKNKLRYSLLIIGALLALFIVGCAKNKTTDTTQKVAKPETVLYQKLNETDRKNVVVNMTATAEKLKQESAEHEEIFVNVDMKITNKTKKIVKFDLAAIRPDSYVDLVKRSGKSDFVKIKPGKTYTHKKIIVATYLDFSSPARFAYYVSPTESITLDEHIDIKNRVEADEWNKELQLEAAEQLKNGTSSTSDSTNENTTDNKKVVESLTDQQLTNWAATLTPGHVDPRFTKYDFNYLVVPENGQRTVVITENHNTQAMKDAGADPETAPTVAVLFVNEKGQLQDKYLGTIWAESYPK